MLSASKMDFVVANQLSTRLRVLLRACLALVIVILLGASLCGAQGTYTAASAAESDVNAVINGPTHTAVNGDIIQIPCSGTQSVIWTSTLRVNANITFTVLGATPNSGPSTFGAGTNCLTIVDNNPSGPILFFAPTYGHNVTTIKNFNIDPVTATTPLFIPFAVSGTCTPSGCPLVRINNLIFGNSTHWNENGNTSNADSMITVNNIFGVADHNTLPNGSAVVFANISHTAYLGVGSFGDNSWAQPDSFGGANAFFLENNLIDVGGRSVTDSELGPNGGDFGGTRQVDRFNHIIENSAFGTFGHHGLDSGGRPRAGRQLEAYNNTLTCNGGACNIISGYRGGTGRTFQNTLTQTNGGFWNELVATATYRVVQSSTPWAGCGGLNSIDPFDTNDNIVYFSGTLSATNGSLTMTDSSKSFPNLVPTGAPYSVRDITKNFISEIASNTATTITISTAGGAPGAGSFNNGDSYQIIGATVCMDQGGRGQGGYISGSSPTPVGPVNEALDPIYEWDDSDSPKAINNANIGSITRRVIINRDFFSDNWLTNGGSAPQAQTSSTSPFNGSGANGIGVGFGTLANRPPCSSGCIVGVGYWATDQGNWNTSDSGGQGELFTWNGSSWVLYYVPYSYPHPLTAGGTSTGNAPQPPTNLNESVN